MTTPLSIDPRKVSLSEQDIEDWLWENPESVYVHKWIARQYKLPAGIADLVGADVHGCVCVVEVKNVEINKAAILQVCRYGADVKQILTSIPGYVFHDDYGNPVIRMIVVGKSIDDQTFYEAESCEVAINTFDVQLTVNVSSRIWSRDFQRGRHEALATIAQQPEWQALGGQDAVPSVLDIDLAQMLEPQSTSNAEGEDE